MIFDWNTHYVSHEYFDNAFDWASSGPDDGESNKKLIAAFLLLMQDP